VYLGAKRRYINTLPFLSFPWQRYCTALYYWASARSAKLSGVKHRAPARPIFGRAAIMLGIGPHSSFLYSNRRCKPTLGEIDIVMLTMLVFLKRL